MRARLAGIVSIALALVGPAKAAQPIAPVDAFCARADLPISEAPGKP